MDMRLQTKIDFRRFASLGLWTSLMVGTIGGPLLWAKSDGSSRESAPVVVFRPKPSMSLQPRPLSAPVRHLGQQPVFSVVLLGIEAIDESEAAPRALPSVGEWTPRR
jgi:hypothetical protein